MIVWPALSVLLTDIVKQGRTDDRWVSIWPELTTCLCHALCPAPQRKRALASGLGVRAKNNPLPTVTIRPRTETLKMKFKYRCGNKRFKDVPIVAGLGIWQWWAPSLTFLLAVVLCWTRGQLAKTCPILHAPQKASFYSFLHQPVGKKSLCHKYNQALAYSHPDSVHHPQKYKPSWERLAYNNSYFTICKAGEC